MMQFKNKNEILSSKNNLIQVFFEFANLKSLWRQGWLQAGLPEKKCESVADHSFASAILAWLVAEEYRTDLDMEKIIKMALLHEVGEIYAGDLTPNDNVSQNEKFLLEYSSMKKVLSKLPNAKAWCELWEEFDRGKTAEAVFVKQIDKLEMALQAKIYETNNKLQSDGFYKSAQKVMESDEFKILFAEISER
jgi:putative hydrolase of HD superfamily